MIKIILPASEIPKGSTVIKKTGGVQYKIYDSLSVYTKGQERQEIKCFDGSRLLLGTTESISTVSADTELVWITDSDTLIQFLEKDLADD